MAAVLVALMLVAAACGDRGDDDGSGGESSATTAPADAGSGDGAGDFGDLTERLWAGRRRARCRSPTTRPRPRASRRTPSRSAPSPTPASPAVPASTRRSSTPVRPSWQWCNDAGGINGRQLELTLYDAAVSNYQPQIEAACENEFATRRFGRGARQPVARGRRPLWPDRRGRLLGDPREGRAWPVATRSRPARSSRCPTRPTGRSSAAASLLAEEFPDSTSDGLHPERRPGHPDHPGRQGDRGLRAGRLRLHRQATYNILGEANWTPFASDISDAGATMLRLVGEGENMALLQQALEEVGYTPERDVPGRQLL